MMTLHRLALAELLHDRRTTSSIAATIALPMAALTSFVAPTIGALGFSSLPFLFFTPFGMVFGLIIVSFVSVISGSAFSAAIVRRRLRYRALARLGAERRHFRTLLLWECALPAAAGLLGGFAAGVAIVLLLPNLTHVGPTQFLATAFLLGIPAVAGVLLATLPKTTRVGQLNDSVRPAPHARSNRRPAQGAFLVLGGSFVVLVASIIAFNRTVDLPGGSADYAWLGAILGVVGVIGGVASLTPWLISLLSDRIQRGGERQLALRSMAAHPERAAGFTTAIIALSTLLVMAAAGIISDIDQYDGPGDGRQAVLSAPNDAARARIADIAESHDNPVVGSVILPNQFSQLVAMNERGQGQDSTTARITPELAKLLNFSATDLEFAAAGGVLVDSDVIDHVHAIGAPDDTVPIRVVRRGGGVRQPGPVLYLIDEATDANEFPQTELFHFATEISNDMASDLVEVPEGRQWMDLPRAGDEAFLETLILAGGALLFGLALAASNIAAAELEDDVAVHVALGASPRIRPRILATQAAIQLLVGVTLGSTLGIVLFRIVTWGDASVPDAIVPGRAIAALVIGALLAVMAVRIGLLSSEWGVTCW